MTKFSLIFCKFHRFSTSVQNLAFLFLGAKTKRICTGEVKIGHEVLGAYITEIKIITISVSYVLFVAVLLLLHKTHLWKEIRAVSNNPELCNIYGINSNKVILWATAISSALAAVASILIALDVDVTPTFGLNYFMYGMVAMIIGGVGSYRGLVFGFWLLPNIWRRIILIQNGWIPWRILSLFCF